MTAQLAHERPDQLQAQRLSLLRIQARRQAHPVVTHDDLHGSVPIVTQSDPDFPGTPVREGVFKRVGDQFVEDQRAADGLRQDRQKAGPRRWFQNPVIRRDRSGCQSGKAERDRRRKLLEVLAFLGTPGLRRQ